MAAARGGGRRGVLRERRQWGGRRQRRTRRPARRNRAAAPPCAPARSSSRTRSRASRSRRSTTPSSWRGRRRRLGDGCRRDWSLLAPAAKPEGVALGEAVGDGQDGDREGVAKLGPLGASRIFTAVATCSRTRCCSSTTLRVARTAPPSATSRRSSTRAAPTRCADALGLVVEARARQGVRRWGVGWRRRPLEQTFARGVWFLLEADDGEVNRAARARARSPPAFPRRAARFALERRRRRARRRARRAGRLHRRPRHAVDAPRGAGGGADRGAASRDCTSASSTSGGAAGSLADWRGSFGEA